MESVRKARERMLSYPILLAKCTKSASIYAACVTRDLNIEHKLCDKEFLEFKKCLQQSARDMKTKL